MLGKFIAFEGIDGSGKTLQVELLKKDFPQFVYTQEPTNQFIGQTISKVVSNKVELNYISLQLLFVADRLHHLEKLILPSLKSGKNVVSDRYFWSTIAYGARYVPKEWLLELNRFCLVPDLIILLDIDPSVALRRIKNTRSQKSIFEKENILKSTREVYLSLAKQFSKQTLLINGQESPETIHQKILNRINLLLK